MNPNLRTQIAGMIQPRTSLRPLALRLAPGRSRAGLLASLFLTAAALTGIERPGRAAEAGQAFDWGIMIAGREAALPKLSNATLMSGNSDWSLALRADGTLLAYGSNTFGQTNAPSGDQWVHAAAGWRHGIACKADGTVDEWGEPYGENIDDWEALRPPISTAIQVAAGDDHSAALLADGTVLAWGGRAAVTNMSGVINDAVQIASGWYHLVILHENGTVSAFGHVSQVGQYFTPLIPLTGVVKVAASQFASYAVLGDGRLVAWGTLNTFGELTVPLHVTNVVSVAGGRYHTIAAKADGTVIAWGDNSQGQLNIPVGLGEAFLVTAGRYHSQAIKRMGGWTVPPGPPGNLRVGGP